MNVECAEEMEIRVRTALVILTEVSLKLTFNVIAVFLKSENSVKELF